MRRNARYFFGRLAALISMVYKLISVGLFMIAALILVIVYAGSRPPKIKDNSILIVRPSGYLSDTPTVAFWPPSGMYREETLLSDYVAALDTAASDPQIEGVWLQLDELDGGGAAGAAELAAAVRRFTDSGKTLVASADTFDNVRYRIASPADHIIVDRLGGVFPTGYGYWRPYYAEGFEKFGVEARLFRSGESKSAAENLILNGMSDAARRNEMILLGDLWTSWLSGVAADRGLSSEFLSDWISQYDQHLENAGGDASRSALDAGLVDTVETGGVAVNALHTHFSHGDRRSIEVTDYLRRRRRILSTGPVIAVVPVEGTLVHGEGGPGLAGSSDVIQSLEQARHTPGVRAIVIRINSPGGDVRAGEEIRRVIEQIRPGIPVVASMGDLAASGGYWIALESDAVFTSPETITGSVGVYNLSLSFEKALSRWLGIRIDGTGTTPWSGLGHPGLSLDERAASLYESGIADIDRMFRTLVQEKRGLTSEDTDALAGGIPWSGVRALENGLADQSGGLTEASAHAAALAELDEWNLMFFDRTPDLREQIFSQVLWGRRSKRVLKKNPRI